MQNQNKIIIKTAKVETNERIIGILSSWEIIIVKLQLKQNKIFGMLLLNKCSFRKYVIKPILHMFF